MEKVKYVISEKEGKYLVEFGFSENESIMKRTAGKIDARIYHEGSMEGEWCSF